MNRRHLVLASLLAAAAFGAHAQSALDTILAKKSITIAIPTDS